MRGIQQRAPLPVVPATPPEPLSCAVCGRGYATIQSDFSELAPVLRSVVRERRRFERLHGHGFSSSKAPVGAPGTATNVTGSVCA